MDVNVHPERALRACGHWSNYGEEHVRESPFRYEVKRQVLSLRVWDPSLLASLDSAVTVTFPEISTRRSALHQSKEVQKFRLFRSSKYVHCCREGDKNAFILKHELSMMLSK